MFQWLRSLFQDQRIVIDSSPGKGRTVEISSEIPAKYHPRLREFFTDLPLKEGTVFIAGSLEKKPEISFSRHIPSDLHQRVRNFLLNINW